MLLLSIIFLLKYDARGRQGFTSLRKCTPSLRLMAYRASADSLDECLRMSKKTARESIYEFSRGVVELFGPIYLRKPTTTDVQQQYVLHEEKHGFLACL